MKRNDDLPPPRGEEDMVHPTPMQSDETPTTVYGLILEGNPKQSFCMGQDCYNEGIAYGFKTTQGLRVITAERKILAPDELRSMGYGIGDSQTALLVSKLGGNVINSFYTGGVSVDPVQLRLRISAYLRKFIVLDDPAQYDLLAIYVMATYCFKLYRSFPYLHLTGEKGSGKTTALDVLESVVFNGKLHIGMTPAVLFRTIHNCAPTLLIDEAENLRQIDRGQSDAIMTTLRAGYKQGAEVPRCEDKNFDNIRSFRVYSPKILASINEIDPVLRDRTIPIRMRRKTSTDQVIDYRGEPSDVAEAEEIREQCYLFGLQHSQNLRRRYTDQSVRIYGSDQFENRERELMLPLLAIADYIDITANDLQHTLANEIIKVGKVCMMAKAEEDLMDDEEFDIIQRVRSALRAKTVKPGRVDNGLHWYDTQEFYRAVKPYKEGKAMSKSSFSRLLKRHGIVSDTYHTPSGTRRGYRVNRDAFLSESGSGTAPKP